VTNETPRAEHRWLQRLVGEWTFESSCIMGPDAPPMNVSGTASIRPFGELWIHIDNRNAPESGGLGFFTLGFDAAKERFAGSFVATCMSSHWVYDGGAVNDSEELILDAEGPSFTGSGTSKYQDIIRQVDADNWELRSQMLGDDGVWVPFMSAQYRRVASA
jgi:hypothetical protein